MPTELPLFLMVFIVAASIVAAIAYVIASRAIRANQSQHLLQQQSLELKNVQLQTELAGVSQRIATVSESLAHEQAQLGVATKRLHSVMTALEVSKTEFRESQKSQQQLQAELVHSREKLDAQQHQYAQLLSQHAELTAKLKERDHSHTKQLQQFDQQKQALTKEFENLAHKIFEEKGKTFNSSNQHNIQQLLQPFSQQLEGFQKRVNDVHGESLQSNTHLHAEIDKVVKMGVQMSSEANQLASALKGDQKALGCWGELQAEKLLQLEGLKEGVEYFREESYKTDDNRDQRPDFIINLPNDKHLIIDSKMSLNAYLKASQAQTESERLQHLKDHLKAIRQHFSDLSQKNYTALKGVNSPEFVFMFIGNEPAYLAALEVEPNLVQGAYRKGIAIVTPSTLLASLKIVTQLWSVDKQNKNTLELAEQASKLYDKLRIFVEKMEKVGTQLNTVTKTYDDSWHTLVSSKVSLTKQAEKFVAMGVTVKEKLPASLTEE